MPTTNQEILNQAAQRTGYLGGDPFADEDAVREYFTIENLENAFGRDYDETLTQTELAEYAATVIAERSHMLDEELRMPLLGHGGLLDDLRHCTTTAGTTLGTLCRHDDPEVSQAAQTAYDQLARIDAIISLTQGLALGGVLDLPKPSQTDLEWWSEYVKELPTDQQSIVERMHRVRPKPRS